MKAVPTRKQAIQRAVEWAGRTVEKWGVNSGEWRVASGEWRVTSGEWRVAGGGMLADPLREEICERQEESTVIDTPLQKAARGFWCAGF